QALDARHDAVHAAAHLEVRFRWLEMDVAGIEIERACKQVIDQADDRRLGVEVIEILVFLEGHQCAFVFLDLRRQLGAPVAQQARDLFATAGAEAQARIHDETQARAAFDARQIDVYECSALPVVERRSHVGRLQQLVEHRQVHGKGRRGIHGASPVACGLRLKAVTLRLPRYWRRLLLRENALIKRRGRSASTAARKGRICCSSRAKLMSWLTTSHSPLLPTRATLISRRLTPEPATAWRSRRCTLDAASPGLSPCSTQ